MTTPYYADESVTLYLGDMRDVLLTLPLEIDCVVTDPPYGETSLAWDNWPHLWPSLIPGASMWCFGSMRMFLDRREEFGSWRISQDIVWEKPRGTSFVTDRFARVHEFAVHWYRGAWADIHHETPREEHHGKRVAVPVRTSQGPGHHGARGQTTYIDDGYRLARSVRYVESVRQGQTGTEHPTQKPVGILDPLIRYACPPGGTVLDPFAGSGSTADAARASGRRTVLIEGHEPYCEVIARRLSQGDLFGTTA